MALNNGLRSASKLFTASESLLSKSVNRGIHSTGVKRMGGGHAHGHDEPFYLHAKHMYNLDRMKYQKIKMPLAVFTAFSIGVMVFTAAGALFSNLKAFVYPCLLGDRKKGMEQHGRLFERQFMLAKCRLQAYICKIRVF
uniref:Uncharacterized protein n=1 Tax=Populus alba TaxID=43335 RepID=A0A4U5QXA3_POPAL|nr:uncharacterized protein D5086_0000250090 [Populus alba]TKS15758.1 uncharacterized protein D5086_0000030040 [Populus alba]